MKLFILSKNEFSLHVKEIALKAGKYDEIFYLDDFCKDEDVLDFMNDFVLHIDDNTDFFSGFEQDERRCEWFNKLMELGANIATIIDPSASIDPSARVLPGCFIDENVVIEDHCLIKTGCYVKPSTNIPSHTTLEINGMSIGSIVTH